MQGTDFLCTVRSSVERADPRKRGLPQVSVFGDSIYFSQQAVFTVPQNRDLRRRRNKSHSCKTSSTLKSRRRNTGAGLLLRLCLEATIAIIVILNTRSSNFPPKCVYNRHWLLFFDLSRSLMISIGFGKFYSIINLVL